MAEVCYVFLGSSYWAAVTGQQLLGSSYWVAVTRQQRRCELCAMAVQRQCARALLEVSRLKLTPYRSMRRFMRHNRFISQVLCAPTSIMQLWSCNKETTAMATCGLVPGQLGRRARPSRKQKAPVPGIPPTKLTRNGHRSYSREPGPNSQSIQQPTPGLRLFLSCLLTIA